MSSTNQTPNYHLSQWQPEDSFLREDFNADHRKLDTGLSAAQAAADRALAALEPVGYNLYNLLLREYYEGKYTGYKKALLYDGFLDAAQIAQQDDRVFLQDKALRLGRGAQPDYASARGTGMNRTGISETLTITGAATLLSTDVLLSMGGAYTNPVYANVYVNGTLRHSKRLDTRTNEQEARTFTFDTPVLVFPGDALYISFSTQEDKGYFGLMPDNKTVYAPMHFQSVAVASGQVTSTPYPLPAGGGLVGWVCHSPGGTVALTAKRSEVEYPLPALATRPAVNLRGVPCVETAYRLDAAIPIGDYALHLALSLTTADTLSVYHYGAMLL